MFAKVFAQILDSSIAEDYRVRLVFEDLLKLADKDGIVDITPESIARRTNVPIEIVSLGLAALAAPDPASRTPDYEGRRIRLLEPFRKWGWKIVNFSKYRESATKEMLKMSESERKAEYRRRKGFPPRPLSQKSTEAEAEAEAEPSRVVPNVSGTCPGQIKILPDTNARIIIHFLNEKTGRAFREVGANLGVISARLKESGVDLDGCRKMIERQVILWKGTDMERFIQPSTLFGKEKFDGYYSAKDLPANKKTYGTNSNNRQENDRNAGTYNAGKASQYANVGKRPPVVVPNQQPGASLTP